MFTFFRGTLDGQIKKDCYSYEKLLEDPLLRFSGVYSEQCASLMVKCQLFNKGKPIGLPVTTSYKAFSKRYSWNEWVTLPLQFCDLFRSTVLCLTILDCAGPGKMVCIGGTTIALFGKNGIFCQGMFDLKVWPNREADGNHPSSTPGNSIDLESNNQMQRLAKIAKKHRNGQIPKIDWLDRLTFREIEVVFNLA
jgi:phosphatidylinositol 3-kinase